MIHKTNIGISGKLFFTALFLITLFILPYLAEAAGTPAGTNITNYASATYEDANANSYSASSNTVTTTVNAVYSVSVNSPADQSGNSNTSVDYIYTVTNTGNDNNTFALSASSSGGWTVTLYADDGAGGGIAGDCIRQSGETTVITSTGSLAPDASYCFFMTVTIPANTADGTTDTETLTVTGSGDPGSGDDTSDVVITTAQAPTLSITKNVRNVTAGGSFATTATADPGDTLEYRIEVTNGGSVTATSVVLTDNDSAYTTYVAESIWIGPDGTAYNGTGNVNVDDDSVQETGETCSADACGQANAVSGNITAYLGNGATESAGGSLAVGSTVYIYFRVTVD